MKHSTSGMGILLLFLILFVRANCEKRHSSCDECCPPAEDIFPCKCKYSYISFDEPAAMEIQCTGVSVEEIEEAFDNLHGKSIHHVRFDNVNGGRLPSDLFQDNDVRMISLTNCDLEGLSDAGGRPAFTGLENSLERLEIESSIKGANELKNLGLSHLKQLKEIHLDMNTVREVGNDWFAKGPRSLERIIVQRCVLSKLGDTAFARLANLRTLDLSGNQLNTIERSMFPKTASQLWSLDFNENNFNSLPNDIFSGMPSLRSVNLAGNLIRRIEEKTWNSVWGSQLNLLLNNNPLECDSHMEWMFSLETPMIWGKCESPEGVKGVQLSDFIKNNRKSLLLAVNSSSSAT